MSDYDIRNRGSWIENSFDSKIFESLLKKHEELVFAFCEKYDVKLVAMGFTDESGNPEVDFSFSDGSGYYTVEGLEASLKEDS